MTDYSDYIRKVWEVEIFRQMAGNCQKIDFGQFRMVPKKRPEDCFQIVFRGFGRTLERLSKRTLQESRPQIVIGKSVNFYPFRKITKSEIPTGSADSGRNLFKLWHVQTARGQEFKKSSRFPDSQNNWNPANLQVRLSRNWMAISLWGVPQYNQFTAVRLLKTCIRKLLGSGDVHGNNQTLRKWSFETVGQFSGS